MKNRLFRQHLSPRDILAIDPRALDVEYSQQEQQSQEAVDEIAVVNICGPLEHHSSFFWISYDGIVKQLEQAFESEAKAVVMCIDSPGGDAAGATEAHRKIRRLKKKYGKPLYAYSNESMYSAAYSIGCAADEIWVPETGGVGSVGVICALLDKTQQNEKLGLNIKLLTSGKRKADGQADRELTEDVITTMQERVDYLADVFFAVVGKARKMTPKKVAALEAGVFLGQNAVDSGLADGVAGWYKFIQYVGQQIGNETTNVNKESQDSAIEETSKMKTKAQLEKARDKAAAKLANAKSESERKSLFAAYEGAVLELSDFTAKTKYVKKTEERLTEEDDDDDEDEEEEEEATSKKAKTKSASALSKKTVDRLYTVASSLANSEDPSEIIGALEGMSSRLAKQDKLENRLGKIENRDRKSRVESMLRKAQDDKKITPHQAKGLIEAGMRDPKWLKGFLSQQKQVVRSSEEPFLPPSNGASAQTLDMQNLSADQKKMLQQAANSAGMKLEDYVVKVNETRVNKASRSNGAVSNGV